MIAAIVWMSRVTAGDSEVAKIREQSGVAMNTPNATFISFADFNHALDAFPPRRPILRVIDLVPDLFNRSFNAPDSDETVSCHRGSRGALFDCEWFRFRDIKRQ